MSYYLKISVTSDVHRDEVYFYYRNMILQGLHCAVCVEFNNMSWEVAFSNRTHFMDAVLK